MSDILDEISEPDPFAPDDIADTGPQLPQAIGSERALLGEMLSSPRSALPIARRLQPEMFYRPVHEEIYRVLLALVNRNPAGVDPAMVVAELQRKKLTTALRYLGGLAGEFAVNPDWHITRVVQAHRARRLLEIATRLQQIAHTHDENDEDDDLLYGAALEGVKLELLVNERDGDDAINGLSTWSQFLDTPDSPYDWVVENLLERQDVVMVLGIEGDGKSWFDRQLMLLVAMGIHPFDWHEPIEPMRTLQIDFENAESMVRRQTRPLQTKGVRHLEKLQGYVGGYDPDRAWVWAWPDGLDLRRQKDANLFERVVDQTRPDVIGLGSLYKAFQRRGDDWDTAAAETREVLDHIRRKYRCAFVLEHHMAKGDPRPREPYGSSEWMRWCSHGRVLRQVADDVWAFETGTFRKDRDRREWPAGLQRGGEFPWSPLSERDMAVFLDDPREERRGARR